MNYFDHFNIARSRWLKHYDECVEELDLDPGYQERQWADEAWQESEQIKILDVSNVQRWQKIPV